MLFNSFDFLIFFPLVTLIYFLLPHKFRWFHLLVASCVFYMFFIPVYILILFFTIIIDYIAGIVIENAPDNRRKLFLVLSIVTNVGVLAFFKYYNFFATNFNEFFHITNIHANIALVKFILPIGLSFHTFQAMSYTLEVYRGNQKAERHFGIYALYVMFYPQLVAGPIERPQNVLHQFHIKHDFNWDNCKDGLKLMMWGFFKKIVIAERLSMVVNNVYKEPEKYNGASFAIAAIFFSFQIYTDFSGYSDIAIGSAKVMGFDLMQNFNRPYSSRSISEFWRRWHISLSTWFFDYLFNPLVASLRRWGRFAIAFGLVTTFFISGLWHGASWNFIIWGLFYGVALVYEFFTRDFRARFFEALPAWLGRFVARFLTLSYVIFASIFFRAATFHDARYIISHLFTGWGAVLSYSGIKALITALGGNDTIYGTFNVGLGLLLIFTLEYLQKKMENNRVSAIMQGKPAMWRWSFYLLIVTSILFLGAYNEQEFIYFQF